MKRKLFALSLAAALLALCGTSFAASLGTPKTLSVDVKLPIADVVGDGGVQPLSGYFRAELTGDYAGREVRYYLPENMAVRTYFHFIAFSSSPDDIDYAIEETGWKEIADETGEGLVILMPGKDGWGDVADEVKYISAARGVPGTLGSTGGYFTSFGLFYLTGYGEGAAVLEAWASQNPHVVIAQTYVNHDDADKVAQLREFRSKAGEEFFGWNHMTDGDRATLDDGRQRYLVQVAERLKGIINPDAGENAGLLKKKDFPIPTWYIDHNDSEGVKYWTAANRTSEHPVISTTELGSVKSSASVYTQTGSTWPTEFAGHISRFTDVSIEEFTIPDDVELKDGFDIIVGSGKLKELTHAIRNNMAQYSRYDNSIAYGNSLTYRVNYTDILRRRFNDSAKTASGTVTVRNHPNSKSAAAGHATTNAELMFMRVRTEDDFNAELLLYIPETAGTKDVPVMMVWHGNTQTAPLFFDSTNWWQVANDEGFALAFITRTYHSGTDSTHELFILPSVCEILKGYKQLDLTRLYCTGQSRGSVTTSLMAHRRPEYFAAVASTNQPGNGLHANPRASIPAAFFIGEGNYAFRGIPGYSADADNPDHSAEAAKAGADICWNGPKPGDPNDKTPTMNEWISYYLSANEPRMGSLTLDPRVIYRGASTLNSGTDKIDGTLADWSTNNARFRTWNYRDKDGRAIVSYTMSMYNAHNNRPDYGQYIWDFVKNFRSTYDDETKTLTRFYSASAFTEDDEVKLSSEVYERDLTTDTSVDP